MADEPERIWFRLRGYIDGASTLEVVLAQLLDACTELEELGQAGYVLKQPVEADGLVLARPEPGPNVSESAHGGKRLEVPEALVNPCTPATSTVSATPPPEGWRSLGD